MRENFWKDKSVLVTGATGAWGSKLCWHLLQMPVRRVLGFARGEHRVALLAESLQDDRFRIRLGDIRDPSRLRQAIEGVDIVIHTAAFKRVDSAQENTLELIKTNVDGTMNVVEACVSCRPHAAVFISSDKAVEPHNLYGATKMVGEHLWLSGNIYAPAPRPCSFRVFRAGNALGSTGSVLSIWKRELAQGKPLTMTDPCMTRFHLSLTEAVYGVLHAAEDQSGTRVFTPAMKAYAIGTLAKAFAPEARWNIVGPRPGGEKKHERITIEGPQSDEVPRLSVDALRVILREEGWRQ